MQNPLILPFIQPQENEQNKRTSPIIEYHRDILMSIGKITNFTHYAYYLSHHKNSVPYQRRSGQ